jgi:hypothetical protein
MIPILNANREQITVVATIKSGETIICKSMEELNDLFLNHPDCYLAFQNSDTRAQEDVL